MPEIHLQTLFTFAGYEAYFTCTCIVHSWYSTVGYASKTTANVMAVYSNIHIGSRETTTPKIQLCSHTANLAIDQGYL